jgi:hypothetical protein
MKTIMNECTRQPGYRKASRFILTLLLCGAYTFCANASSAQPKGDVQKELLKTADAVWSAFENKDNASMQALLSPDFVFVGKEGILSGAELGIGTASCSLHNFELSSSQLHALSAHGAVLTYKVQQNYECNGKPEPAQLFVSDSFVFTRGKWLLVAHAETVPAALPLP